MGVKRNTYIGQVLLCKSMGDSGTYVYVGGQKLPYDYAGKRVMLVPIEVQSSLPTGIINNHTKRRFRLPGLPVLRISGNDESGLRFEYIGE